MTINPDRRVYLSPEGWEHEVAPIMKFRLTYRGPILPSQPGNPSSDSPKQQSLSEHKMEIRKAFHRQLKRLWSVHPTLSNLQYCKNCGIENRHVSEHLGTGIEGHDLAFVKDYLANQFPLNEYRFAPIACRDFGVLCQVEILFLRHGDPSGTVRGGDLDNRVKTVIDALSKPTQVNQLSQKYANPEDGETPFFTVMEDDSLVSSLTVTSDTLLEEFEYPDANGRDAMLVIAIDIRPYMPTHFNLAFA